jgi:hypothetical protein
MHTQTNIIDGNKYVILFVEGLDGLVATHHISFTEHHADAVLLERLSNLT